LAFMPPYFGPNAFEILATVSVIKWTEGHA
jgi:hypothetical protein